MHVSEMLYCDLKSAAAQRKKELKKERNDRSFPWCEDDQQLSVALSDNTHVVCIVYGLAVTDEACVTPDLVMFWLIQME